MAPDLVIETQGLHKTFGPTVAVTDLTLSVQQGEVFGFLGPNGAGKTTSVKMLLGLVKPTEGEGQVLGARIGDVAARAKVGFLPEHFRFQDWLTGREFLRVHGKLYDLGGGALEARIETLLNRMDLLHAGDRELRGYSKGMLQRIGLAQALLNRPALVFLDEPTSGLDPLGRLLVRNLLQELKSEGTTIFLNSHQLGEVEAVCDRVVFIKRGIVIRELNLTEHDANRVTVQLRAHGLRPEVETELIHFGEVLSHEGDEWMLLMHGEDRVPRLARWLVQHDVAIHHLAVQKQSLESLFLETMGADERPG